MQRHFHTIAVDRESLAALGAVADAPLLVFGNHPSWWDPLVAHFVCRQCLGGRQFYAPIDASALERYRVFARLGFFGVELNHRRGAAEFLRTSLAILSQPRGSLWLTPEGRFADVRDVSAEFQPGIAHLCTRMPSNVVVLPMAVEYVFWDERLPECLLRFGQPIRCGEFSELDKTAWQAKLFAALRETQASLATASIARNPEPFEPLLSGKRGAGVYDHFRRLRHFFEGSRFRAEHGEKFN